MGNFSERTDVVVRIGEQMFDHSALKAHPSRECFQQAFVDSVFTNLLANPLGFFFLVGPFHGQVGHHGLFPIFVDHVPTDVRCYRAPGTEALRANPIRKAMAPQRGFHVGLNALDFSHGFVVGHRRAVGVAATTNDDGEAVAAVVAKADFLMGAAEHFDLHVGQFNVGHLVHGGVDDKQLRCHGACLWYRQRTRGFEECGVLPKAGCKTGWSPSWST